MKKLTLTFLLFGTSLQLFAQKTEFSIALNSGFFSFSGKSAATTTFINASQSLEAAYTNNPYGANSGFSYGLSVNAKQLLTGSLFFGLELGYERLSSSITINQVTRNTQTNAIYLPATGSTKLNTDFINIHPHLGYRYMVSSIAIDFTGGFDLGFVVKSTEKGEATSSDGILFTTFNDRKTIDTDFRPRIQLAAKRNRIGGYIGYSQSLKNYMGKYIGGSFNATPKMIRWGLSYQLK